MIDTDNSGQITFEELKVGLKKVGANLKESEIYDLMQAVSIFLSTSYEIERKQVISFMMIYKMNRK